MKTRNLTVSLGLLATLLQACASTDPELQAEVDARIKAPRTPDKVYLGRLPFSPLPLATGQWAEYLGCSVDKEPILLRQEVVGEEADGFWIQQTQTTCSAKSWIKFLVAKPGDRNLRPGESEIRRVLHRDREGEITELEELAPLIEEGVLSYKTPKVTGDVGVTVTVAAGTFKNSVLERELADDDPVVGVQQWFHSEVPLMAIVKTVSVGGEEDEEVSWELLGFGLTGAKDMFEVGGQEAPRSDSVQ